uniref:Uncharacterized protein n=1 Tax=Rhizophora mucronata TaxID=61149 RepID=A0A2P2P0H6_RHIMU
MLHGASLSMTLLSLPKTQSIQLFKKKTDHTYILLVYMVDCHINLKVAKFPIPPDF